MARIRTVKPGFFRHHGLFLAELEAGLPLRVAFAGLFTVADREGLFRWRPAELKLDCLPHDNVDFSEVLDHLKRHGFIARFCGSTCTHGRAPVEEGACTGEYGFIPGFPVHQRVGHREAASSLPPPPEHARAREFPGAARARPGVPGGKGREGEGKGREGEGKGREGGPVRGPGISEGDDLDRTTEPHPPTPSPLRGEGGNHNRDGSSGGGEPIDVSAGAHSGLPGDPSGTFPPADPAEPCAACAMAFHTLGFCRFWHAWPERRRTGNGSAWTEWCAQECEAIAGEVLAAVEAHAVGHPDWLKNGGEFIPKPANWLHDRCWLDTVPADLPDAVSPNGGAGRGDSLDDILAEGG